VICEKTQEHALWLNFRTQFNKKSRNMRTGLQPSPIETSAKDVDL